MKITLALLAAAFLVLAAPIASAQQAHTVYLPQILNNQPRYVFAQCTDTPGLECIQDGYPAP